MGQEKIEYKPVGCYTMKGGQYGGILRKLTINTSNRRETVSECGRVAWERARRVFAVGENGECYSSMDSHHVYHKYGEASDCKENITGGASSAYVYALNGMILETTVTVSSLSFTFFFISNFLFTCQFPWF